MFSGIGLAWLGRVFNNQILYFTGIGYIVCDIASDLRSYEKSKEIKDLNIVLGGAFGYVSSFFMALIGKQLINYKFGIKNDILPKSDNIVILAGAVLGNVIGANYNKNIPLINMNTALRNTIRLICSISAVIAADFFAYNNQKPLCTWSFKEIIDSYIFFHFITMLSFMVLNLLGKLEEEEPHRKLEKSRLR